MGRVQAARKTPLGNRFLEYIAVAGRWECPIEGDVKRHFSPSTGGGRFSRTSSPLLGLPEHFVWTAFWWRGQSGWSAFRVFHDDRVNAIRLLKLASRSGWQSANHGPIGDSRPIAFLGYSEGHRVETETGC